jgi:RIO kinase 1
LRVTDNLPKIQKRVGAELFRKERQTRYLIKRSEEEQALEAVFDRQTLFTLYSMINRGLLDYLNGVVRSGKEARVYWGVKNGEDVAVKLFYTVTTSFKNRSVYISGDKRFQRFPKSGRAMIFEWVRKEFKNLTQAYEAGVPVPQPIHVEKNVLMMEFIGKDGKPAPTLADLGQAVLKDYNVLIRHIKKLYREAGLVHGDLSEFNIFKHNQRIVIFDFASAVDRDHPMAEEFLLRDIRNINRFFSRSGVGVKDPEEILREVRGF